MGCSAFYLRVFGEIPPGPEAQLRLWIAFQSLYLEQVLWIYDI
jgi:hypothetical protein